jgi:hypothetical protein
VDANYIATVVKDNPRRTMDKLVKDPNVSVWARFDNNVEFGARPRLIAASDNFKRRE